VRLRGKSEHLSRWNPNRDRQTTKYILRSRACTSCCAKRFRLDIADRPDHTDVMCRGKDGGSIVCEVNASLQIGTFDTPLV